MEENRLDETADRRRPEADRVVPDEKRPMFPLFFDLTDKKIVVVGGGAVARRRIAALVRFGASIILIAPTITDDLQILLNKQKIKHIKSVYKQSDLKRWKPFLVMAATDDRSVNQTIMCDAKRLGIPHIIADCKEECDAYFPAIAENGSFIAGIISKDGDHKAVKDMTQHVRRLFDDE